MRLLFSTLLLSIFRLPANTHTHSTSPNNTPPHLAQPTLRRLAPPLHHHSIALHAPRNVVPCIRHGVEFFLECACVLYTLRTGGVACVVGVVVVLIRGGGNGARGGGCACVVDIVVILGVLADGGEFVFGEGEAGAEAEYLDGKEEEWSANCVEGKRGEPEWEDELWDGDDGCVGRCCLD